MKKSLLELSLLHFLNDGVRTTFVTMLPFIAKDLHITLSSVGFLGSSQPLFASILALPAGFIGSKLGGFKFLSLLLVVYCFGALMVGVSSNLLLIILGFFLGALGFGMFHTVSFSLVAKISDPLNMGKNMGNFTSIGDIGRISIPPASVFLLSIFGWRSAMIVISIIGLVLFLVLRLYTPKKEPLVKEGKKRETHEDFLKIVYTLLKSRKLFFTLFASLLDSLASSPVYLFLPFLLFGKGITVPQYGIATAIYFTGSLSGKSVLGRLVDKMGNLKVFILSESLMALSLVFLTGSSSYLIILLLCFFLGMFTRGTTPVIQTMLSQTSHKMHYDKIFGLGEMFIGIAAVVTIILMGLIADKFGIQFVFYTSAALALLALLPTFPLSKSK